MPASDAKLNLFQPAWKRIESELRYGLSAIPIYQGHAAHILVSGRILMASYDEGDGNNQRYG